MRIVIMMAVVWLSGCAHVISTDIIEQINTDIEFTSLLKAPQDYQGQMVLLGGIIVNTVNRADGTLLEVYQTRMDSTTGKPIDVDESQGRFLALYEGFLDGAIYRKGRKVTIAGIVTGERVMKIGQVDYHYPYLVIKEIYLWKEDQRYEPYPWDPWDPWWGYPWHPWDDPYWRCPKC